METTVSTPEAKKVNKSTAKKVKAVKVASVELSKGLYQSTSKEFYLKFPEVKAMRERLGKAGYGFFRVEITCAPLKKPTAKIVNIIKHNAPDDWSNK